MGSKQIILHMEILQLIPAQPESIRSQVTPGLKECSVKESTS